MEKLMFKKVELWTVLLAAMAGFVGTIIFGVLVRNVALGYDEFGVVGRVAYAIASVPSDIRLLMRNNMLAEDGGRFGDRRGWDFSQAKDDALPDGYLLLSRYDGDLDRHVVELFNFENGLVEFSWLIDADYLLSDASRESSLINYNRWNTKQFRAIHPIALEDGGLVIKDHQSPLMRIDACGGLVWRLDDDLYHHTTEPDLDGAFWVTTHQEPSGVKGLSPDFYDDAIVQVSASGEVLFQRSLTALMIKHGYKNLMFSREDYYRDPLHLNDVQPVAQDGVYWKSGDVFLSVRHLSMIILYRPSTDEIVWMKQGPWAAQHDVDIIDDHTIAVFSNNMYNMGYGEIVDGSNDILFYDFSTDKVSAPYSDLFEKNEIRTATEGLFTLLPTGHLLVEEDDAGRFLIFGRSGKLSAEYVNRAKDGQIYMMGWSRYIDRAFGDNLRDQVLGLVCEYQKLSN